MWISFYRIMSIGSVLKIGLVKIPKTDFQTRTMYINLLKK